MMIHTCEKPYHCSQCDKAFFQKRPLKYSYMFQVTESWLFKKYNYMKISGCCFNMQSSQSRSQVLMFQYAVPVNEIKLILSDLVWYRQSGFHGLFHPKKGGVGAFIRHFRGASGAQKLPRVPWIHLRGTKITRGTPGEPQNWLWDLFLIIEIHFGIVIRIRNASDV